MVSIFHVLLGLSYILDSRVRFTTRLRIEISNKQASKHDLRKDHPSSCRKSTISRAQLGPEPLHRALHPTPIPDNLEYSKDWVG